MDRRQEITGRRKDGSEFPAEASIARVTTQGESTFLAILRDISERKRAEGALRRSEEHFRRIFDYSNDAILVIDLADGGIANANPRACSIFGTPTLYTQRIRSGFAPLSTRSCRRR